MILCIDNYDSFTFNLLHLFRRVAPRRPLEVVRNDQITCRDIRRWAPEAIVISPGPGRPQDAGISLEVIRELHRDCAILGVCLGHQCLGEAFGGRTVAAPQCVHGKTSPIHHAGGGLYAGLPSPLVGARYHSLLVDRQQLPAELRIAAWTADGEVMGLEHIRLPLFGIQFHPESFMTHCGESLIANFLRAAATPPGRQVAATGVADPEAA